MTAPWVDNAERRLGFIALPNLAFFLAGMNALCALLAFIKPEFPQRLTLEPWLILQGQAWRALTFIFVPPPCRRCGCCFGFAVLVVFERSARLKI